MKPSLKLTLELIGTHSAKSWLLRVFLGLCSFLSMFFFQYKFHITCVCERNVIPSLPNTNTLSSGLLCFSDIFLVIFVRFSYLLFVERKNGAFSKLSFPVPTLIFHFLREARSEARQSFLIYCQLPLKCTQLFPKAQLKKHTKLYTLLLDKNPKTQILFLLRHSKFDSL